MQLNQREEALLKAIYESQGAQIFPGTHGFPLETSQYELAYREVVLLCHRGLIGSVTRIDTANGNVSFQACVTRHVALKL